MNDQPGSLRRPLDEAPWPDKLTARVVAPGPRPTIHGYDVEEDLARHYSFAETVLLALTGKIPTAEQGRAFEVALQFAAPSPISEAPTHAAVLARVCAGTTSSIQGTAAIALAEQARSLVDEHRGWVQQLSSAAAILCTEAGTVSAQERESVDRLRRALRGTIDVPALAHDLSRSAALLATLHACGLTNAEQMECALVLAKLPVATAEALATPAGSYRDYPLLVPPIVYSEIGP
jgi:citrate synthase